MFLQNIQFIPSVPVFSAFVAFVCIYLFLLLYSHAPLRVRKTGSRLWVALFSAFVVWVVLIVILGKTNWLTLDGFLDLLAGFFVLIIGAWFSVNLWGILAWGFRISMLMSLQKHENPVSEDEWILDYAGGQGMETFLYDRLGLAIRLGMAERDGRRIRLTPSMGALTVWVGNMSRRWFLYKGEL